jgi:hypothetical protein
MQRLVNVHKFLAPETDSRDNSETYADSCGFALECLQMLSVRIQNSCN